MSKSDQEQHAAARRAERLAERAGERARRKEREAIRAAERAVRLAHRAGHRVSRDLENSMEDLVDKVADQWNHKAQQWLEEQKSKLRDHYEGEDVEGADKKAREARREAKRLRVKADKAARRVSELEKERGRGGRIKLRRRHGNFYRDSKKAKVCGVCAGAAQYLGVPIWQARLAAVMGLVFMPQIIIPVYFIFYFLMDDKPYYRQVTDRYDEPEQAMAEVYAKRSQDSGRALRDTKEKFSDIEARLRTMESHVTSSHFELNRELNKLSGERAS